jgi:hypothetical protein
LERSGSCRFSPEPLGNEMFTWSIGRNKKTLTISHDIINFYQCLSCNILSQNMFVVNVVRKKSVEMDDLDIRRPVVKPQSITNFVSTINPSQTSYKHL